MKIKSAADIIGKDALAKLREAGFVVIHREPSESMGKAFYGSDWPETVSFKDGFHRMVATSIREQNQPDQD
jgi:hypothetical protein